LSPKSGGGAISEGIEFRNSNQPFISKKRNDVEMSLLLPPRSLYFCGHDRHGLKFFTFSIVGECVAPGSVPPPIPHGTLISLFVFIRHGARTPFLYQSPSVEGVWHCGHRVAAPPHRIPIIKGHPVSLQFNAKSDRPYAPDCREGELLDEGFTQLESLGAAYRTYLTEMNALLPRRYAPEMIAVK
jgi:hypothetical protein